MVCSLKLCGFWFINLLRFCTEIKMPVFFATSFCNWGAVFILRRAFKKVFNRQLMATGQLLQEHFEFPLPSMPRNDGYSCGQY